MKIPKGWRRLVNGETMRRGDRKLPSWSKDWEPIDERAVGEIHIRTRKYSHFPAIRKIT